MASTAHLKHLMQTFGPECRLAYITFTPNGASAPTVSESHGFSSTVTRSGAGVYVCTVSEPRCLAMQVVVDAVPGDTNYHEYTKALSTSARTVTITHRTVTYANIVSAGPAASDTSGAITVLCLVRVAS